MSTTTSSEQSKTMRRTLARLPPLTAMRAFVVSAKHLSFTLAADELHVTSAAIGQQVRLLEDHLGTPLFERNRGRLELTETGRRLMPGLSEAFSRMIETIADLTQTDHPAIVRLSVSPSFASKWLVPRLDDLRRAAPHVEVLVQATTHLSNIEDEDIDCVIRYGAGVSSGLVVDPIFPEAIVPICSPEFAQRYGLAPGIRALNDTPLIHEIGPEHDTSCPTWADWLRTEGMALRSDTGIRMNLSSLVIDAAIAGQGLGLGKLRLCEADLAAGRLVIPFGTARPVGFSYFFATLPHKAKLPHVEIFRSWLRSQALQMHRIDLKAPPESETTSTIAPYQAGSDVQSILRQ